MYSKVFVMAVTLAVVSAQSNGNYGGHGHGQAVSSQSIVLNQEHAPVHHAPVHYAPVHDIPVIAHQPAHYAYAHEPEHYAPAHYAFEYSVEDPNTGDAKSQHEEREGDHVTGFYSLHEADGTIRRVDYTVDPHSGFNAVVHREGHASHSAPAPVHPVHH